MTSRGHGIIFRHGRGFSAGLAFACIAVLSACASATIEDAVPQGAGAAPIATTAASASPEGAVDTGTYPNLNIEPVAATVQLTPAQRAAKEAELKAARARLAGQGGNAPSSDTQPLNRLAQTHADDVLSEIEAGQ